MKFVTGNSFYSGRENCQLFIICSSEVNSQILIYPGILICYEMKGLVAILFLSWIVLVSRSTAQHVPESQAQRTSGGPPGWGEQVPDTFQFWWSSVQDNLTRAAPSPSSHPHYQIHWKAPFCTGGGYAEEARTQVLALTRAIGHASSGPGSAIRWSIVPQMIGTLPPGQGEVCQKTLEAWGQQYREGDPPDRTITVWHSTPDQWDSPSMKRSGDLWIGRTMFETDSVPLDWRQALLHVDALWFPSEWNQRIFHRFLHQARVPWEPPVPPMFTVEEGRGRVGSDQGMGIDGAWGGSVA